MGRVRAWAFDAVIGVGGIGAEPERNRIAGKVNWIGIGPRRHVGLDKRGPVLTFEHFLYFGEDGPSFIKKAPALAHRIYSRNVRVLMDGVDARERREIKRLLNLAKDAPRSRGSGRQAATSHRACGHRSAHRASSNGSCSVCGRKMK